MLPVAIVLWPIAAFGVKASATETIASTSTKKCVLVSRSRIILIPRRPGRKTKGAMDSRMQMDCQNSIARSGCGEERKHWEYRRLRENSPESRLWRPLAWTAIRKARFCHDDNSDVFALPCCGLSFAMRSRYGGAKVACIGVASRRWLRTLLKAPAQKRNFNRFVKAGGET